MKNNLVLQSVQFCGLPYWTVPIPKTDIFRYPSCVALFDHNGYDLTPLERMYSRVNTSQPLHKYRGTHSILKKKWFTQPIQREGYILNHAMLLERKGYGGMALEQLHTEAMHNPLLYKMIQYQTKWGIDISIDYISKGDCFEVFHYEYDSFDLNKIHDMKDKIERLVVGMDITNVAKDLQRCKKDWYHLEFFQQSKWKTAYFGNVSRW